MNKKIIVILIALCIIVIGCSKKLSPEEYREKQAFCEQFSTQDTCDSTSCEWGEKVKCAIPGENCGFAYTGRKECFYQIDKD